MSAVIATTANHGFSYAMLESVVVRAYEITYTPFCRFVSSRRKWDFSTYKITAITK